MSIKKILVFTLLALLAYVGGYMTIYGFERYMMYSGTERDFDLMSASELQPQLNVRGSIETVTHLLYTEKVIARVLGFPVGEATQYYYVLPVGYQKDSQKQQFCLFAVSDPDDAAAVEGLMKDAPVPPDPNAPRFEFRGMALNMSDEIYQRFENYLRNEYSDYEFNIHDILLGKDVSDILVPYVIYVKGRYDDNFVLPIAVGGVCFIAGAGLFVLLAVRTYRKKHKYD